MQHCPGCAVACDSADHFCSDCGAPLPAAEMRGGERCVIGAGLAALSDAGLVHRSNDDAFMISGPPDGGPGTVIVVCDGVSNSQTPDLAAAVAARAAHDSLVQALACATAVEDATRHAILEAHRAVCALTHDRHNPLDPPAATIIVASIGIGPRGTMAVTVGWLGDSRLYWLSENRSADGGGALLTRDHSWLNDVLDRGAMMPAAAHADPRASALVACLGSTDFTTPTICPEPSIRSIESDENGWLLACSDGLWAYAPTPAELVAAAGIGGPIDDAMGLGERLIACARAGGGRDNITGALARIRGRNCVAFSGSG
jgi:serine/threonine protein phosphatase PrpC